jgi:hypothetical protein
MAFSLTELLDVSSIQGQGVTGTDLMNPLNLAQKLGYSFLGTWALYSVGADEMVFNFMQSQLGVPDAVSAPASAVVLGAGADLIGGEVRRIVMNVTSSS